MRRQRNMLQMKEQDNISEKELNQRGDINLPDNEFNGNGHKDAQ